jgi:hypothetical protein
MGLDDLVVTSEDARARLHEPFDAAKQRDAFEFGGTRYVSADSRALAGTRSSRRTTSSRI